MKELSLNFLLERKSPYVGGPSERVYEFSRPTLLGPSRRPVPLQTGQLDSSGPVVGVTMRLLEELGHRARNLRTGDGDFTAGMKEAMETMGIDTEGIYDTGRLKDRLNKFRVDRKEAKAADLLADAARIAGRASGPAALSNIPTTELQSAVVAKQTERAAAALFDKERYSVWRPLSLVKSQSIAAGATVAISQTPARDMWATFLVVTGGEYFSFTSLVIMGETMFNGDAELSPGAFQPNSTAQQELNMLLKSGINVTGGFKNTDAGGAHFGGVSIQGYIERLETSRK